MIFAVVNAQKAFLSVAGITARGFYNSNMLLVETERYMMRCADRTIVLADSSKFGHSSLARLCDWGHVETLVVDDGLDNVWRQQVHDSKTHLILAGPDESEQLDAPENIPSLKQIS